MDYKQALKYTGKTLASIAFPPALGLWGKEILGRMALSGLGILISLLGASAVDYSSEKIIYKSEELQVLTMRRPSNNRHGIEFISSPLIYYLDGPPITTNVNEINNTWSVEGKDVITFSNGKYQLNFGLERRFEGCLIQEEEAHAKKCEIEFKGYLQRGDIAGARMSKIRAENARVFLNDRTSEYQKTKAVFQKAVDAMNSELEVLAESTGK